MLLVSLLTTSLTISCVANDLSNSPIIDNQSIPDGCEWAVYIGLSDASILALRQAQDNPVNSEQEKISIRRDREKIAEQDQNFLDNCDN